MKKLIFGSLLSAILFFGCNSDPGFGPVQNDSPKSWLKLPQSSKLMVNTIHQFNKEIDGQNGGDLKISGNLSDNVYVEGTLVVPQNAFFGKQTISVTLDDNAATAAYSPSPFSFNVPLVLTIEYRGLNLSGVNPEKLQFYHLTNSGQWVRVDHDGIAVDLTNGRVKVTNARLPHFSRYGFAE